MMTSGFVSSSFSPFSPCPALPFRFGDTWACSWRESSSMALPKVNVRKWAVFWPTYLMSFWHHLMLSIAGKWTALSYSFCSPLLTINGGVVVENLDRNFWSRNRQELFALSCSFSISNLYHPFPVFYKVKKKLKSASERFHAFVA